MCHAAEDTYLRSRGFDRELHEGRGIYSRMPELDFVHLPHSSQMLGLITAFLRFCHSWLRPELSLSWSCGVFRLLIWAIAEVPVACGFNICDSRVFWRPLAAA